MLKTQLYHEISLRKVSAYLINANNVTESESVANIDQRHMTKIIIMLRRIESEMATKIYINVAKTVSAGSDTL